jgi:alpha-methylacyl-CoA racemase
MNEMKSTRQGPLVGLRIVEFAGIGPAPFGVMLLADLGAEVLRINRAGATWPDVPIVSRGRASLELDLKDPEGLATALQITEMADVLVEGFRPGVMERIGLGPEPLSARNPRLVYARMTGWGQTGPLAAKAGHDLNFVGLTGMLDAVTRPGERPVPPQNLLGDYACGGAYLAFGILAALYERQSSGRGQVVDAAIVDGSASMLAPILGMMAAGLLPNKPQMGMLAGDAPFYRTYGCADGRFLAVGSLEPHFQAALAEKLGLDDLSDDDQVGAVLATRTRDEWVDFLSETDCCVSPVLDLAEARSHPHVAERGLFIRDGGDGFQPAPSPRFSRSTAGVPETTFASVMLASWGLEGVVP